MPMSEQMKAVRLMIAAEMAEAAFEQVRGIITTPENVEALGEIQIALEDVMQKAPVLANTLVTQEQNRAAHGE